MSISPDELIGPYERWALGPGAPYVGFDPDARNSEFVAALVELPPGAVPERLAVSRGIDWCRFPTLWQPAFKASEPTFCPVVLSRRGRSPVFDDAASLAMRLKALGGGTSGEAIEGSQITYRINGPLRAATLNAGFRLSAADGGEETGSLPEADVIVAVIDDGIPFAHRNLRDANGATRIDHFWLQGEDADPNPARHSVLFGREYLAGEIDAMIDAFGDEDRLYASVIREAVVRGARRRGLASHGAHVLDMAAGHRHGAPPDPLRPTGDKGHLDGVRIIAVQLPEPVTLDTAGLGKDAYVLSAFHYVFERAARIGKRAGRQLPLVINFSYGFTGGPHGGRDRIERALRSLVRQRVAEVAPTHLVMPAGNSFLSALFGEIPPVRQQRVVDGTASAFSIPWRIQPCDRTPNYLEIWLPPGACPDGIKLTVRDPYRTILQEIAINGTPRPVKHHNLTGPGGVIGQVSLERFATGSMEALWRFVVAVAPTEPSNLSLPAAPSGLWQIELRGLGPVRLVGPIACRIQRDIDPFGYAYGARQSYFDDPLDQPVDAAGRPARADNPDDAFVRRYGTLNGLATHDAVTVVGSFVRGSHEPAAYASAGSRQSTAGQARIHLSAPSESSPALGGIPAAGARSGAIVRLSGTSMAAPQVARALAVAFLNGADAGTVEGLLRGRLVRVDGKGATAADRRARLGNALLGPAGEAPGVP
jgi:hypothetical protein